ncbi:MAG: V-type ATPase 116kDa subunit family protein [Candidatus Heimdallarchaeaceae archaeon]|jgi:V/A-type H+-transporting ATPase subunit I
MGLFGSPQKLIKIQVPKEHTYRFINKIDNLSLFNQVIVDPQNPKEQVNIQELIDKYQDHKSRLLNISSIFQFSIGDLSLEDIDLKDYNNSSQLSIETQTFLDEYEEIILTKFEKLQQLKKEERILSSLSLFQGQVEQDDFSIDLLSSGSRTSTFIGEIPASYENLIQFYLIEITSNQIFFWTTPSEGKEKKILICIALQDYKDQVEKILTENHFDSTKYDLNILKSLENLKEEESIKELLNRTIPEISALDAELNDYSTKINEKVIHYISLIQKSLRLLSIEEKGRTTEKEFTAWGWIKKKDFDDLKSELSSLGLDPKFVLLDDVPFPPKKTKDEFDEEIIVKPLEPIAAEDLKHVPHLSHRGVKAEGGFLFPKKSSFVKLETEAKSSREFISKIHSLNTVHPIKVGSLDSKTLENINSQKIELNQYLSRIKKISELLDISEPNAIIKNKYQIVDDFSHSKAFIEKFLRDYENEVIELSTEHNQLKRQLEQIKLYLPFEQELRDKGLDVDLLKEGFQTVTQLGSIPKNHYKAVRFFLNEVSDNNVLLWASDPVDSAKNEKNILLLSLKEYETAILRVLNEYSFQPIEFDLSVLQKEISLEQTKNQLNEQISESEEKISKLKDKIIEELAVSNEIVNVELERIKTAELCQVAEDKITIWGWIPSSGMKKLNKLKKEFQADIEISINPEVPLANPSITKKGKFFGAVRGLVRGIGEPNPHEVDPFSLVRFTFPLLFGMMFADVGHGIMLAIIGALFAIRKKRKKIKPDESMSGYIYGGAELLIVCGLAATVFGFIFGSILGDEFYLPGIYEHWGIHWLPLVNPLHEIKLFLAISITIGFFMLQLGILLKVYQNIKYGHGISSVLAPFSLSIVYIGIFSVLYNLIVGGGIQGHVIDLPPLPGWLAYTLGALPLLFIFEYLHAKSEGIMDAIDHIIALLSNTLSFSRIMALLLVHAILSALPFTLSGIEGVVSVSSVIMPISTPLEVYHAVEVVAPLAQSWLWWVVGFFVGLFIIVPIEGLLSFLNTLRLHWVEWFSKFFVGDGKAYNPLTEQLAFIDFIPAKGS